VRYYANPSEGQVQDAMQSGVLGMIATPAQGNALPAGVTWCADNGCFGKGYPGDAAWLSWLDTYTDEERSRCVFATAPDVVGDAAATLARARPHLPAIRQLGYPTALVGQDGLENLAVPWDEFDVLFLGGSTEWKLGPAARALTAEAKARGKHAHMGRVNSLQRLRYADAIGCDSADGTFLTFGPTVNLARLRGWLRAVNNQAALWQAGWLRPDRESGGRP
jgi:hypothetical protein